MEKKFQTLGPRHINGHAEVHACILITAEELTMLILFQKYPQSDPNEADDPNVRIQNDVPITGKPPILADPDYYNDQYYTTPRPYRDPSRPHRKRKIPSQYEQQNYNPEYYTTPSPNRVLYSTPSRPNYQQPDYDSQNYGQYQTTPRPNPFYNFAKPATNPNADYYDDDYESTARPNNNNYVIYATPSSSTGQTNVYNIPNRVLYASDSRPSKKTRLYENQ